MSDASVMTEYLIALGFKTDEASYRKFTAAMAAIEVAAIAVGEAVMQAAEQVAEQGVKMVSGLDQLYWASLRIGASAENIKAFAYGMSQAGLSSQQAIGALDAVAEKLNTNPGMEALMRSLGVQTKDVNGNIRDTTELVTALGKQLAAVPMWRATQIGQMFGLGYQQVMALRRDPGGQGMKQYNDEAEKLGINFDKAAANSEAFTHQLRLMQAQFEMLLAPSVTGALEILAKAMGRLEAWASKNADSISALSSSVSGLVTSVGHLVGALSHLGGVNWGGAWLDFFSSKLKHMRDLLEEVSALLRGDVNGAAKWGVQAVYDENNLSGGPMAATGALSVARSAGGSVRGSNDNNTLNLRNVGGKGFQIFANAQDGFAAAARQLIIDQDRHGDMTLAQIINRWAPASDGNNVQAYIGDVARRTGINPNRRIDLHDLATLVPVLDAMSRHEKGHSYARELITAGADRAIASQSVVINVHGTANAEETARHVARVQAQASSDLQRNFAPKMF